MKTKLGAIVIVFIFAISCKPAFQDTTASIDKKACRFFEEKIAMVEDFHNQTSGYSNELESASYFLERVTAIKAEAKYNYTAIGNTTGKDLNEWKSWFENNKQNLYWDKNEQTVKVKINRTFVSVN